MKADRWVIIGLLWRGVTGPVSAGEAQETQAVPAESAISVSFAVELASTYYWRGFNLTDGTWVAQPEIQVRHLPSGLWFSLWNSHALHDRRASGDADEVDLTAGWDVPLGPRLEAGFGGTLYVYPRGSGEAGWSRELFARMGLPAVPLAPAVTFYHDFDQGRGGYVTLSGGHAFRRLELGLESGFSFHQYTQKSGFTDLVADMSYRLDLGDHGSLAPFLRLGLIRDRERNPDDAMLWFGLSLSWEQ